MAQGCLERSETFGDGFSGLSGQVRVQGWGIV